MLGLRFHAGAANIFDVFEQKPRISSISQIKPRKLVIPFIPALFQIISI